MHAFLRKVSHAHKFCFRNFTDRRREFTDEKFQKSCLPGTVRPDKPDPVVRPDAERDIVEDLSCAEVELYVDCGDQGEIIYEMCGSCGNAGGLTYRGVRVQRSGKKLASCLCDDRSLDSYSLKPSSHFPRYQCRPSQR